MSTSYLCRCASEIENRFFPEDWASGVDLSPIGALVSSEKVKIDIPRNAVIKAADLKAHLPTAVQFVEEEKGGIWFMVNYPDNAVNVYLGIGYLAVGSHFADNVYWESFVANYLCTHRAAQNGDGSFIVFGHDFEWAVNFELRPDEGMLSAEIYQQQ